jgi:hypothetical protein
MTDQILAVLLVVTFAACVGYAVLLRLREIRGEQRNRPVTFRGINRFKTAPQRPDIWSLN